MEYMTARETAKKWNVSVRLIQRLCAEGRIEGARKSGVVWEVPSDAVRPKDLRIKREVEMIYRNPSFSNLMPLINTAFLPGRCLEVIHRMKKGPKRDIAFAEYHYFSGHPKEAVRETENYLTCRDTELRLSACLIYAYSNLSIGEIHRARYALEEIRKTLRADTEKTSHVRSIEAFISATAAVLLHLPLPEELPDAQEFIPSLPLGLRAFALYVQAHHLYLKKKYECSIGIIESALIMGAEHYPIPAIYLHLAAVMDYMSLKQPDKAEEHLLAAWQIARPDDLIEGFGEHHGLLGGMLEAVIKPRWPEDFKRIIAITYEFSAGWRKIHNPETGHNVADDLTTTEFATAMLAARNWTNGEIAEHMNISVNTVKHHVSQAMKKLQVENRKELKKYMLE